MLDQLEEEEEFSYILMGDLNARIGDWGLRVGEAEADEEDDLESIDRNSQDEVINANGHKLIQTCIAFNATPLSGLKNKRFDGNFTFLGRRGSSTIDHFVCSADILDHVESYKTLSRVESQHMPIEMVMGSGLNDNSERGRNKETAREVEKYTWKEAKKGECANILNKDRTIRAIEEASEILEDSIEEGLESFDKILQDVHKPMRSTFKQGGDKDQKKKWFDRDCEIKKKEARQALVNLNKINAKRRKPEYNRAKEEYLDKRISYQKTVREKRKQYKNEMQEKLINSRHDSKSFWGEIRKISFRRPKLANITIDQWGDHFKEVFNTNREEVEGLGNVENVDQAGGAEREVEQRHREGIEREIREAEDQMDSDEEIEELDEEITREEIINGIDKLKKREGSGGRQYFS